MVAEGTMVHGLHMGSLILHELGDLTKLHSRHVEQAGFAVLKEAGMVSVLVETGFISNPDEEMKLIDPDYQQQMAETIFSGVKRFAQKYPIPQTYFAAGNEQKSRKNRDKVLQEIAPPAPKIVNNQPEKLIDKPIDKSKVLEEVDSVVICERKNSDSFSNANLHICIRSSYDAILIPVFKI